MTIVTSMLHIPLYFLVALARFFLNKELSKYWEQKTSLALLLMLAANLLFATGSDAREPNRSVNLSYCIGFLT